MRGYAYMSLFTDDTKRNQLVIGAIMAAACVIYLVVVVLGDMLTEAVNFRFKDANDVFNGTAPTFEYPPLAMIFVLIPRVFASTELWYNVGFVIEMAIFFMIGLYMTCKIAEVLGKSQKIFMLAYVLLMALMFEFVVDRYDIIPVAITLAAVYCFLTKRYTWAFVLLSLGTMIKLYPAVLFPAFIIPLIMNNEKMEALKGAIAFITVSAAIVLVTMIIQPDMLSYFIGYHADRPLQIESVTASLLYPFVMVGLADRSFEYSYGSENIVGPIPDAIAPWLTPLMGVCILALYVFYVYVLKKINGRGDSNDRLYLFAGISLLAVLLFIIVGKVMSTQYLMWMIPSMIFMLMLSSDDRWAKKVFILFAVTIIVAQAQFTLISGYMGGGEALTDPANVILANIGMIMIIVKNVLLLFVMYLVIRSVYERYVSLKSSGSVTDEF